MVFRSEETGLDYIQGSNSLHATCYDTWRDLANQALVPSGEPVVLKGTTLDCWRAKNCFCKPSKADCDRIFGAVVWKWVKEESAWRGLAKRWCYSWIAKAWICTVGAHHKLHVGTNFSVEISINITLTLLYIKTHFQAKSRRWWRKILFVSDTLKVFYSFQLGGLGKYKRYGKSFPKTGNKNSSNPTPPPFSFLFSPPTPPARQIIIMVMLQLG